METFKKKLVKRINYWTVGLYNQMPFWCFPERQLRFHAYCVGMPKTGTVSITVIFEKHYRVAHEPESSFVNHKIIAFANGKIDKSKLIRYVEHKRRHLALEMDSSYLNYFFIDILVNQFSEAKFILTIRDCYSWLESMITQRLFMHQFEKFYIKHGFKGVDDLCFKTEQPHTPEEKILADHELYTLDGYFSHWQKHNSKILTTVPKDRLLVVKTSEINQNIDKMDNFLGITPSTLLTGVHRNVRKKVKGEKLDILSQIDKDFLEEKANFHCKALMDQYFPEVTGFKQT